MTEPEENFRDQTLIICLVYSPCPLENPANLGKD